MTTASVPCFMYHSICEQLTHIMLEEISKDTSLAAGLKQQLKSLGKEFSSVVVDLLKKKPLWTAESQKKQCNVQELMDRAAAELISVTSVIQFSFTQLCSTSLEILCHKCYCMRYFSSPNELYAADRFLHGILCK